MVETADGYGSANDAAIVAKSHIQDLEEQLAVARADEEAKFPQRKIESAERAVAKAEEALAGAKDALAVARAEVDQAEADKPRLEEERKARKAARQAEAEQAANAEAGTGTTTVVGPTDSMIITADDVATVPASETEGI